MIRLFEDKENLKEEFIIGDYEFSFDRSESVIEIEGNQIIDLTIKGNEEVFDHYHPHQFWVVNCIYSPLCLML